MIIGACGYGATGSSIITDLLREFDGLQIFDDFEFTFTYRVDGLQDLEYHLMKNYAKTISGDAAIKRFLYAANYIKTPLLHKPTNAKKFLEITNEFVDSIVQTRFKGMESIDVISGNIPRNIVSLGLKKIIYPRTIEKIKKGPCYLWPNRTLYVSIKPENFYDSAKKYIRDILIAMGADLNRPIVLDQPFEGNAPEQSFAFFDDPRAIIVDRDPRDLYLETKYRHLAECRFLPREDVRNFSIYYRQMRCGRSTTDTDRILNVKFEDLMYNYDETVDKIIAFANLGKHVRKKEVFNPERSINNTQLIRKYPQEKDAIKYIEEHLSEFLYPFELYKDVKTDGEAVLGSAKYAAKNKSLMKGTK
ncbi:MAG: sulfotransferase [Lachnospiraceae bacterium]|nr:sulfotransferase [Lachnospiraceae bacterium]